jgi:predicted phosphodiesterase
MKIAVISDIHGNLDALDKVLADIDTSNVDTIFSLGDNIGYGPEPEAIIRTIQDREIPSIMGNHEMAVADPKHLGWFNITAQESLLKTKKLLSRDSLAYISGLGSSVVDFDCRFVHGFPPDSPTTYSFQVSENELIHTFQKLNENVCFIGHTHCLQLISYDGQSLDEAPLEQGVTVLPEDRQCIVNVGSVGQPRDGDNHAKYVIWDSSAKTIEVKYIPYDIARVVDKIYALGLPKVHANRLW